jgi:hypothetical protein
MIFIFYFPTPQRMSVLPRLPPHDGVGAQRVFENLLD